MSFAILGMGAAVPANRVTQEEAAEAARIVCCHTPEQAALLPLLYRLTGIETRHMVLPQEVVHDVLEGTQQTQSVFLPGEKVDHGPTTSQRLQIYAREAGPLAAQAARQALD